MGLDVYVQIREFFDERKQTKRLSSMKTESKQMLFITSLFTLITVTWSHFNPFSHNNLTEKKLRKLRKTEKTEFLGETRRFSK